MLSQCQIEDLKGANYFFCQEELSILSLLRYLSNSINLRHLNPSSYAYFLLGIEGNSKTSHTRAYSNLISLNQQVSKLLDNFFKFIFRSMHVEENELSFVLLTGNHSWNFSVLCPQALPPQTPQHPGSTSRLPCHVEPMELGIPSLLVSVGVNTLLGWRAKILSYAPTWSWQGTCIVSRMGAQREALLAGRKVSPLLSHCCQLMTGELCYPSRRYASLWFSICSWLPD